MNYGKRMKLELAEQQSEKKIARQRLKSRAEDLWFGLGFGTFFMVLGVMGVKIKVLSEIWPWADFAGNVAPSFLAGWTIVVFVFSAFYFFTAIRSYSARRTLREMDKPDRTIVPEDWAGQWPG